MIRERSIGDMPALIEVAQRVHDRDGYPIYLPDANFEQFIAEPPSIAAWVAVIDGAIAGHVALNAEMSQPVMDLIEARVGGQPTVYVSRLFVDPLARRVGTGRELIERARSEALAMGRLAALDVVDVPSSTAAVALYRSAGWEEIGQVTFDLLDAAITERVFVSSPLGRD